MREVHFSRLEQVTMRRPGFAPAFVLFAILVAHAVLETARDALFLSRLGPHHLASAYLAMAACAVGVVLLMRALGVHNARGMLIRFLLCATGGTAVLAAVIMRSSSVVFEDVRLRADVRRVFVAAGRPALDRLIAALEDPRTPRNLRRHLPRTIARFGSEAAAAALVAHLAREPDGNSEFKILRALGRMRAEHPALMIQRAPVREYVHRAVADAARYATFGDQLVLSGDHASPVRALIGELLAEKRRFAVERAFRGLGILHPRAGLRSVHDAFMHRDEVRRAAAREIVESIVSSDLRSALLAVVDELSPDERRARLGHLAPGPFASYEALAAALLADPSESVRCVVAHHVAERRLIALRGDLERLRPGLGRPFVIEAFDQAMARLDA